MHGTLKDIIDTITQVVLFATPVALVLLLFFWNMSQLIFQSNNAEKMKDARARIIWSIIGLTVLFSLAGIIVLLQNTFFGASNQNFNAPLPSTGSTNTINPGNNGGSDGGAQDPGPFR